MLLINNLRGELERLFQRSVRTEAGTAGIAQQAGTVPYRLTEQGHEVLLVTSRGSGRWVLPKGWLAAGESLVQSAARESYEEAGVIGVVEPVELGRFLATKIRMEISTAHVVVIYPLRVELELADWPERQLRRRQWWSLSEASLIMADHQRGMLGALERSVQRTHGEAELRAPSEAHRRLRARG